MRNYKTIISAAAAALFISGGAFAAGLSPAAGEQPIFDASVASSQLQRQQVESLVAGHMPAAGEESAHAAAADGGNLSRTDVQATVHQMPLAGESA